MCGCSTRQAEKSVDTAAAFPDALTVRVEDMTCGHCAGAIAKAIENGLPGATVQADPASKIVRVSGTTDLAAVRVLIAGAGYTPVEAALA
jgi:copper chaperone